MSGLKFLACHSMMLICSMHMLSLLGVRIASSEYACLWVLSSIMRGEHNRCGIQILLETDLFEVYI
jgi:hypothetical protein